MCIRDRVLSEPEISEILAGNKQWLVFLEERGTWRHYGSRALPPS